MGGAGGGVGSFSMMRTVGIGAGLGNTSAMRGGSGRMAATRMTRLRAIAALRAAMRTWSGWGRRAPARLADDMGDLLTIDVSCGAAALRGGSGDRGTRLQPMPEVMVRASGRLYVQAFQLKPSMRCWARSVPRM